MILYVEESFTIIYLTFMALTLFSPPSIVSFETYPQTCTCYLENLISVHMKSCGYSIYILKHFNAFDSNTSTNSLGSTRTLLTFYFYIYTLIVELYTCRCSYLLMILVVDDLVVLMMTTSNVKRCLVGFSRIYDQATYDDGVYQRSHMKHQ